MANDRPPDGEPPARQPGRPPPERPVPRDEPDNAPASRLISVEMSPRSLRVNPGEVENATLRIRNLGSVVDEITLTVRRDAAEWTRIAPDVLNIYPSTDAEAVVRFAPPRAVRPPAGLYSLEIAINSDRQPEASTIYRGSIELGAYDNLTATAVGSTYLKGRRSAILPIKVRNGGNRAATAYFEAADLPGVAVSLSSPSLTVEPGGEGTVWATVKPRSQFMSGPPREYPYTISVRTDYSPPVTIDGRIEQGPRFAGRRLLFAALGGAALLTIAGAVAANNLGLIKFPSTSDATPTPQPSGSVLPSSSGQPPPTVSGQPTASDVTPSNGPPTATPEGQTEPPTSPTPSPSPTTDPFAGWVDLGGELGHSAAAASWRTNAIQLVAPWADDETLWVNSWNGADWRGWEHVPNSIATEFKPAVVAWESPPGFDQLNLFAIGGDGQMYWQTYDGNGGWSTPLALAGATFDAGPAATSSGVGRIDVFARSAVDGSLLHNWYDFGTWNFWEQWTPNVLRPNLVPGAISWAVGGEFPVLHIVVFAVQDNQDVYSLAYDSTIGLGGLVWQLVGGPVTSGPTVTSWGPPNQFDLFARGPGPDRKLVQNQMVDGINWSGWNTFADFELEHGPASSSWGPGRLDVFASGTDNTLRWRWNDNGVWQP